MTRDDSRMELVRRYVEGVATADEVQSLEAAVRDDPSFRHEFLRYLNIDAALASGIGSSVPASPVNQLVEIQEKAARRSPVGWRRRLAWASVALAIAIGLVSFGLVIAWRAPNSPPSVMPPPAGEIPDVVDDGVALLTQTIDATWLGTHQLQAGSILSAGRLQLTKGLAQLEFYSGARLILEAPVELELVSANRVVCRSGRLRAWVPAHARGFRVVAPQYELVDLGTEFGIEVGANATSRVEVFDGEVELHPVGSMPSPTPVRLLRGAGLKWNGSGERAEIQTNPNGFPSFDVVRRLAEQRAQERHAAWQEWNRGITMDPRIATRYDFEGLKNGLIDSGPRGAHGTIIGCEATNGRWAAKGALEFKRPSDRVRIDIPGIYETLTLSAWIRMDAAPGRIQGLLLTDGYEQGFPHWQISTHGELRLGVKIATSTGALRPSGYGSPELFQPRRVGVWTFVATSYDAKEGKLRHFLDGREVSSETLVSRQPLRIGKADIGNWSSPLAQDPTPVRNFIGRIDELTLWNVALDERELMKIHEVTRP